MSGGGSVEERLARVLTSWDTTGYLWPPEQVRTLMAETGLALYDRATHEVVRLGKVRSAVLCIAEALTEGRDVESALAVGERVLLGGRRGG